MNFIIVSIAYLSFIFSTGIAVAFFINGDENLGIIFGLVSVALFIIIRAIDKSYEEYKRRAPPIWISP